MTDSDTANRLTRPLLEISNLRVRFGGRSIPFIARDASVTAVDDVSFDVFRGEAFGLVGESGSGKTTIGRAIVKLVEPTSGVIRYSGRDISTIRGRDSRGYRQSVQMVFQNPYASLNPRRKVRDMLLDALAVHRMSRTALDEKMADLLQTVGLTAQMLHRFPHQFSGGQRQRVVIARALSVGPSMIVADEPVSALDVSVQAQVLNLLKHLKEDLGLTIVLISHDLRTVSFLCERIGVLYLGQLLELGSRQALLDGPIHPYTRALFEAIPSQHLGAARRRRGLIQGELSGQPPPLGGCVFAPRCDLRRRLGSPDVCTTTRPHLVPVGLEQKVACHFAEEAISEGSASVGVGVVSRRH